MVKVGNVNMHSDWLAAHFPVTAAFEFRCSRCENTVSVVGKIAQSQVSDPSESGSPRWANVAVMPDPPKGWGVYDGKTICDRHRLHMIRQVFIDGEVIQEQRYEPDGRGLREVEPHA